MESAKNTEKKENIHKLTGLIILCWAILLFQYGFVNYALEQLVLRNYGEEIWEQIK